MVSAATPAAEAGSQNTPSSRPSLIHADLNSSSLSVTALTRPAAIIASTFARCAGSPMRIADAKVVLRSAACPTTSDGSIPASRQPAATADTFPPPP